MSDITLTTGIRQNLLSLQQTSADLTTTQEALATGNAVNSAAENPSAYFTSQNLTNSANALSSLLDQIGQGQQTINAATNGLTGLTSLLQQALATAQQAQQSAPPTATYNLAITGNTPIAADTSQATGTAAYSTSGFTASAKSTYTIDTSGGVGAEGDTIKINYNGQAYTFQNDNLGTGVAAGNISYTDKADLGTAIQNIFGAGNVDVGANSITITGSDYTHSLTDGGGTITGTAQAAVDGTKFTITQGSTTATLHYVASGADASAGTFTSLSDLEAAINASSVGNSGGPTLASTVLASDDGSNHLVLESLGTSSFTVGGAAATAQSFGGTSFSANYNSTLAGITGTLSVTVGDGSAQNIDFGTVKTKAALTTALAGLTGVTATINGGGDIAIASTTSDPVTISGTDNAASGLFSDANIGANTPTVTAGTSSSIRATLQDNYNGLLTQMNQLAADSGYNGVNLLNADNLTLNFNATGTSKLTLNGVNDTYTGLGLNSLSNNEFQDDNSISDVENAINAAISTVQAQTETFGTNSGVITTRQTFETNMINTLQTGASNLVAADQNAESADLLTEQTQQQLEISALSIANQANQSVLKLFG